MVWQKRRNICGYWQCNQRIPDDELLCPDHYQGWVTGLIDRCPKCNRFKDVAYQLCPDCYFGRSVTPRKLTPKIPTPKQNYRIEYSAAWVDGYLRQDRFFVYILELDDKELYVGYTADLRKELSGYKEQKKSSPAVPHPKLQYAQIVATQQAAELRQAELKKLIHSNPDQIRLMILDFRSHMREFSLEDDF